MSKLIVFICIFFSTICFSESEFPVNFMMQADVTPISTGFKVESVVASPDNITVHYDLDNEKFNDAHSTLTIDTNIPAERSESFYYDLNLIKNEASCFLNSGAAIPYDAPTLEITNNDGIFVNISTDSPMQWQKFDDVISETKASIKDINMYFSKIPPADFINNYKYCSGEVLLMVGLSI